MDMILKAFEHMFTGHVHTGLQMHRSSDFSGLQMASVVAMVIHFSVYAAGVFLHVSLQLTNVVIVCVRVCAGLSVCNHVHVLKIRRYFKGIRHIFIFYRRI